MKTVNIPHFKDVILMSTVCDHCGYKSNEVKTGGAIPEKGKRITLKVTDPEDLARDILKSETCGLNIPELNLDLTPGTLGGRFTTIEGLLTQVLEELHSRVFTQTSDSMDDETKTRWTGFCKITRCYRWENWIHYCYGRSISFFLYTKCLCSDNDPNMTIEEFERTFDQNEGLGLNDIKTD